MMVAAAILLLVWVVSLGLLAAVADRQRFARDTWVGRMLGEYRWFRRWAGGHWERWWVDYVHAPLWHSVECCAHETGDRPTSVCRGTPTCEDWPEGRTPPASAGLVFATLLSTLVSCAPLPALVTEGQIRAVLPPVHHEAGMRCAERLNGHVRSARAAGVARPVVLAAGAALTATGVLLRDVAPDATAPLAVAGGTVGIVAELVVRLVADPASLLAAHGAGLASLNAARVDPDAGGELLERCVADQGPPRSRLPLLGGGAP